MGTYIVISVPHDPVVKSTAECEEDSQGCLVLEAIGLYGDSKNPRSSRLCN